MNKSYFEKKIRFPLVFFETGSLTAPAVLELAFVYQADLELRDFPASASQVLRLKLCATAVQLIFIFKRYKNFMCRFECMLHVCTAGIYVHVPTEASGFLEPVLSCLLRLTGTKLKSSGMAVSTPNSPAILFSVLG